MAYTSDGSIIPLKNNKYSQKYKNLVINLIKKNNVDVIYIVYPVHKGSIADYLDKSCLKEKLILKGVISYEIKRCKDLNGKKKLMNIHEHQAKEILKEFGAPTTEGLVIFNTENLFEKIKNFKSNQFVLKAQIHAGGRGKAGGVKLVKKEDIINVAKNLFGKVLVTPQTGPEGKAVKRIYVQKAYDISKEFYLSCLVDRKSSKIAFISSTEGGVDIEAVAKKNPEKINTTKVDLKKI